jgi:multicomponent Na+:H+ antiporter subunit D
VNALLVLPILIPLTTAAVLLLAGRRRELQAGLGVAGAACLLAAGVALLVVVWRHGIQASQMGGWPAPFGVTLAADLFSALMVLITGVMGLAVAVYSIVHVDRQRRRFGYYPLYHVLLMGVCGAFLTGDLFNLYVWFEVMLMASFVLLALGGERGQIEGALKYVTLNLIASAAFLAGVGVLYGATGTLNMADLAGKLDDFPDPRVSTILAMLFLTAFGVKAAVFPFFFWLPASYHTPPAAVSAIFAGLLTKVGVYALIRVFTLLFIHETWFTHTLLLVIAALTMVTGVLGAVAQSEVRRILAFHIISQIGYMIMGLALYTPLALAGSVFYISHHIVVKTNLFLIAGVVERLRGSGKLAEVGGLYTARPLLAGAFLISALSLAGMPPFSGFFAKLILIRAGFEAEEYAIVVTALAVGLLTLFSMTKIWNEAFWKPAPAPGKDRPQTTIFESRREKFLSLAPVCSLAACTVAIGLCSGPLFLLATRAAEQLLSREEYIHAVLGAAP